MHTAAPVRPIVDGTFRVVCLIGTVRSSSAHLGAPWRREVIVRAGGATELAVDLEPGVTLFGSVRGEDLLPVGECEIRIGGWDDPSGSFVRTAADGTYRLDAVTLGDFEVTAHERKAGRASVRLHGAPGALLRWDPILTAGARMIVKVVDEFDAPMRGWYAHVGATIDGQWESRWGPTDADGRFVAENCADGSYMVDVTEPGARFPAFRMLGIRPSVDELVLRVTRAMRATAVITGRIVDPEGNGIESAEVSVRREGDPVVVTVRTTADDGRFRIERIPAGSYFVEARARGRPANRSGPHVVSADAVHDAGALRLTAPGWLEIAPATRRGRRSVVETVVRTSAVAEWTSTRMASCRSSRWRAAHTDSGSMASTSSRSRRSWRSSRRRTTSLPASGVLRSASSLAGISATCANCASARSTSGAVVDTRPRTAGRSSGGADSASARGDEARTARRGARAATGVTVRGSGTPAASPISVN